MIIFLTNDIFYNFWVVKRDWINTLHRLRVIGYEHDDVIANPHK